MRVEYPRGRNLAGRGPFGRLVGDCADEAAIYAARARRLGLPFAPAMTLGRGAVVDTAAIRRGTFALATEGERLGYLAPDEAAMPSIAAWLSAYPSAGKRLRVATPSAIRAALTEAGGKRLLARSVGRLATHYPKLSARRVLTAAQMVAAVALTASLAVMFVRWPLATLVAINFAGAALFFGISALRFVAAGVTRGRPPLARAPAAIPDAVLPGYSVLVPLYREAALVGELVAALDNLDWPHDRLDIKLLLEAEDRATIAAARRAVSGAPFEIVIVPEGGPRTKPNALAFVLPLARGDFVTVYDAEDRPHPGQLREAFATFARSSPDLACLQSPLMIDNGPAGWLALSFAIEYAALFDGLLPALAGFGMPMPLGGTSNHFRRAALEAVGGWDPYNVTEDADLGLRLARFGYRSATIELPTLEEAPAALRPWLRQRTRWFKGWMQTWLVHTRSPLRLARELGPRGCLGFTLIATGLIVSAIIYPIYLVSLMVMATDPLNLWGDRSMLAAAAAGLNIFNLVAGYTAMAVLSGSALTLRGRSSEKWGIVMLPFYWLLMSIASYRAIGQLVLRPHHWEKTPHNPRQGAWSRRQRRAGAPSEAL